MQYADLPDSSKQVVQAFMDAYRPTLGAASRLLNQMQTLDDAWASGVSGILASLDSGAVVDTSTGLAGASPLTADEIAVMVTGLQSILAAYNTSTQRQAYIKAAGLPNTL